jgi:ATP-binding cassette subfamily F protein uup
MAPPLVQLQSVSLSFGTKPLFTEVDLAIEPKARIGLVGRNGSGKTTLMKIIEGLIEPDDGGVFKQPGIRIAHMPQDPVLPADKTVLEYILDQPHVTHYQAEQVVEEVGVDGKRTLEKLSGGEKRRVSLAHALAGDPEILMLDEPTNHLDIPMIEWLEKAVNSFPGAILMISHDRTFLANVTRQVFWLDQRKVRVMNRGYGEFEEWSTQIIEHELRTQRKVDKKIEEETEWSHKGITARRKRNQGRLRRLYEMREKRAQYLRQLADAKLAVEAGDMSGRLVVEAKNITKSYGDKVLIKDFTTRIMRGDRIGIIGPNGAGKTTLIRMLTGEEKPDAGHIRLGKGLTAAYLDQSRAALDLKKTLWETFCPEGGDYVQVQDRYVHVVAYLKEFLFDPEQMRSPVSTLSGGERNRLLLAMSLAQKSNFLILDEPTNDLDMDTLDRLQGILSDYDGTLVVVSHDRNFLDNTVTSIISFEGEGVALEYAGGYSDYLNQKARAPKKTVKHQEESPKDGRKSREKTKETKKLSFKHTHALKVIPEKIEALRNEIAEIEEELNNPGIFIDDPDKANMLSQTLLQRKQEIEELEEQWLEIELMREKIEGK